MPGSNRDWTSQYHRSLLRAAVGSRLTVCRGEGGPPPGCETEGCLEGALVGVDHLRRAMVVRLASASDLPQLAETVGVKVFGDSGVYVFSALVTKRQEADLHLTLPNQMEVLRRRRAVRVRLEGEITYWPVAYAGKELSTDHRSTGQLVDVGPYGLGFVTGLRLPEGMRIGLQFGPQPWSELGVLQATIRRVHRQATGYLVGADFGDLPPRLRHRLVSLVLQARQANLTPSAP